MPDTSKPTAADLLAQAEGGSYRRVKTVSLFRADDLEHYEELEAELVAAQRYDLEHNEPSTLPAALKRLRDFEDELEEKAPTIKVGSVSAKTWADLLAGHPPTKAQIAAADEAAGGNWRRMARPECDEEGFFAAALAACAIEPEFTAEEAQLFPERFGATHWAVVKQVIAEVNRGGGGDAPKSVLASGIEARMNGLFGEPATNSESPDQSS